VHDNTARVQNVNQGRHIGFIVLFTMIGLTALTAIIFSLLPFTRNLLVLYAFSFRR
jgi:hypothetical protein